jgi:hypothetical protein
MYVYGGSGWQAAGSSVNGTSERNTYTATAGQTVFAAAYDTGYIDVYLNGVKLLAGTDFTATNGTSITLASGASVNDVVDIVAYGTFVLADHYTKIASDARYVEVAGDTMTGNLNVTGTVTSDGLTVGSATGVFPSEAIQVRGNGGTSGYINGLGLGDANDQFRIFADDTNNTGGSIKFDIRNRDRILIEDNGDISFYEDTGTTAKFHWDASAESLGIGTSSPSNYSSSANDLVIAGSGQRGITIASTDAVQSNLFFADADSGVGEYAGYLAYVHSTDHLAIATGSTERMRIDSSGNLLVGTIDALPVANNDSSGIALRADGNAQFSRSGAATARFNRGTSDGEIVSFSKDGTTVGSIGTQGSAMTIGNGVTGLRFSAAGYVHPHNVTTNAASNGTTDLGANTARFKDLYLSGSAFIDTQTRLANGSATTPSYSFSSDSDSGMFRATTNALGFATAGAERMRIDSSGNLMISNLDTDPYDNNSSGGGGIALRSTGAIYNAVYQGTPCVFNRMGNDGDVVQVRRDGAKIGAIGIASGSTFFSGSNNYSLMLASDFRPRTGDGSGNYDAQVDLGDSSSRFKDLYLSGGVYLGGTGAVNKLEDYEEGTWTPAVHQAGFTISNPTARYTKIGRLVTVTCDCDLSGTGNGNDMKISGLPFTSLSAGHASGAGYTQYYPSAQSGSNAAFVPKSGNNDTFVYFQNGNGARYDGDRFSAGFLNFTITYFTS